ncbi:hypothetical protein WJX84_003893 [Apatococcus fuscideae]|uniref:Uncharacterized protein n=1 Tax=Apatococcus fuscideae TaxID=2026836 RepID=A0AAW1TBL5_9CHLO
MAEEPSLAPQWLKSGIATPSTSSLRTEEGGEVGGRPAALPSPRVTPDGPGRDPFAPRRSSDWTGKPSQVAGQSGQPSWDKPSLRAHHRGGAHRNIFEDHSHDIFGPSSSGASKHSNPHHHRAGPSTPSSPYRPGKEAPKDFTKDFSKESGKDYGGAWTADPHQGQAGSRAGNPRDRPVNARGPVLNGAGSDGKAAGRGAGQRPQQALDKDFLPSPRQQVTTAAAMQQVASERQREEKLLARQAKLIPVAFSGPRPRQGVASHLGDRAQGAKPSTLTGLGPTASSKALLGVPRSSGLTEGRGAAPTPAANRRSSMPEEVPVSSGPTPLTLSFSVPSTDKPGMNGQQSNLARASSDVERNTRQAILSPTKAAPAQNGLPSAAASAKPPGTPTGLQNKAKERNSFFQSLRRTRTATGASERPSSSSSLSPASSLDAPSLATSGRAETGDTPGLSSLSERVQEQLASEHAAQNGFHAQIGSAAMDRQQEGHGSSLDDAEVLKMLDMTAEDLAFMRRLGWTPEPASSEEAGGLTDEEIQAFREQQKAKPTKVVGRMPAPIAGRPRSAPYPCPPVSPWRSANGSQHLANLDVGSYGSKLSDSESEPE